MCYGVACESFNWFKEGAMFALVNLPKIRYPKVKTTPWRLPSYMFWMGKFNAASLWKNLNPDTRTLKTFRSIARASAIASSRSWHLSLTQLKSTSWLNDNRASQATWQTNPDRLNMSSKNRLRILWIYVSNSDATNLGTRLRRHHWFPRQMTSEKRAQKFHTDDASLPRSG